MKYAGAICFFLIMSCGLACKKKPNASELARVLQVLPPEPQKKTFGEFEGLDNPALYGRGASEEDRRTNLCRVHEKFWKNITAIYGDRAARAPEIAPCSTDSFEITTVTSSVSLVRRSKFDTTSESYPFMNEVWMLENNVWQPILTAKNEVGKAMVVDLNGDKVPDIILENEYLSTFDIFIGKASGGIGHTQTLTGLINSKIDYSEPCKAWIKAEGDVILDSGETKNISVLARFNCTTNRFELAEK